MGVCEHLSKLSPSISQETLAYVLENLWSTRRTGLSSSQKRHFQSLLALSGLQDLDPVLACLREIIRKCVHENLAGDDIKKILPLDLSIEFQNILLILLQKYQNQWKEETLQDQVGKTEKKKKRKEECSNQNYTISQCTLCLVGAAAPHVVPPCTLSKIFSKQLPWQEDMMSYLKSSRLDDTILNHDVPNLPHAVTNNNIYQSKGLLDGMGILPCLKSMTWSMQDENLTPSNRMAVITLKLEDRTKSPTREIEVKFQLYKDTLEAMLRSMTHISEKLSNSVNQEQPSEPSLKKPRQSKNSDE